MTDPNEQDIQPPQNIEVPTQLPLLPVRDIVVFPYMVLPLFVGRDMSIKAIEAALAGNRMIFLATQKALDVENPSPKDIHTIGTVGIIMRMLKLPDERIKILVQGIAKAKITKYIQTDPYYSVRIDKLVDSKPTATTLEAEAVMRTVKEQIERIVSLGKVLIPDVMVVIENLEEPGRLADMVASNLGLKVDATQAVLEISDPIQRLRQVSDILGKEIEVLSMQQKIQAQAKGEMDKTQREYFLREQLKAIQKELGELDERAEEITEFRKRIKESKMPEKVLRETEKQLKRLEKMHPDTAESATVRTYLEWMVELPWSKRSKDNLELKAAAKVLNEDHYDLEKVKERILEYLAVRKLKEKMKGPILCFVGPPGVGKTSLGKSIARALGREFVRISLGGVRDEAEIRGHRRTYVGALPGRIIQGMKQAGTGNPVFMLDEVDKVGMDFRGDPSAALLEVLDPEQNSAFTDHYLGVPFDLTEVMFITTANLIDPILPALRDRMEVIEIPGYTEEEKLGIAQKYLIPRQLEEHGITSKHVRLTEQAIRQIISHYTREAGVRNLEREIANVMRKVAKKVAEGKGQGFPIDQSNLQKYLGVSKYVPEAELEKDEIGVATGLAWTESGGDVLYIEATVMKGKGQLTLTGHLGDVMKESAQAALSYVRSREKTLNLNPGMFSRQDLHIHVPAGAIPKDGPSAGITMATAIASAFSGTPARRDLAMTGEITLRGRVLPIGGLKEKILAAKRAKLTTVILPRRNKKDLEEIPKHLLKGIQLAFVDTMDDVMRIALRRRIKAPSTSNKPSVPPAPVHIRPSRSGKGRRSHELLPCCEPGVNQFDRRIASWPLVRQTLQEFTLIRRVKDQFARRSPGLVQGIGDDAAVVEIGVPGWWHFTTDLLAEGIHFDLKSCSPTSIGYRAAIANLSDLAAMGAVPRYLLVSLAIPTHMNQSHLDALYRGMMKACRPYDVALIGGDTSASNAGLFLSITLLGTTAKQRALFRHGAQVGDQIYVSGTLGDSLAGLRLLLDGTTSRSSKKNESYLSPFHRQFLIGRHLKPTARVAEGQWLNNGRLATAAIDLSDGLSGDLRHICEESGVGAEVEIDHLPLSPACRAYANAYGISAVRLAITGGEDYELLFTASTRYRPTLERQARARGFHITRIGTIRPKKFGIQMTVEGRTQPLPQISYEHFR